MIGIFLKYYHWIDYSTQIINHYYSIIKYYPIYLLLRTNDYLPHLLEIFFQFLSPLYSSEIWDMYILLVLFVFSNIELLRVSPSINFLNNLLLISLINLLIPHILFLLITSFLYLISLLYSYLPVIYVSGAIPNYFHT